MMNTDLVEPIQSVKQPGFRGVYQTPSKKQPYTTEGRRN